MAIHLGRGMSEVAAAQKRPVSLWTKAAYGFGAAAYGIKNNGFDYFFLIFFKVIANLARCPNLPFFFAAAFSLDAGIFLPFLIPKDFLKAPGFLIAF